MGTQNGHVQLYARVGNSYFNYELKTTLELAPRYITQMAWSPIATNKLAVVANAHNIHILEFNHETGDLQVKRKLEVKGPKAAHPCVKWSNRNENYFLTCGFDGAIRVWDLSKEKNPEIFVKTYHCPMTCGLFLPTDEEVIICSGKSATLEFIDMRLEKSQSNSGKSKRTNALTLDTVSWATKVLTQTDNKSMANDKKHNRRLTKTPENNVDILETTVIQQSVGENIENGITNSEEVSTMLEKLHLQKTEATVNNSSIFMKVCKNKNLKFTFLLITQV